MKAYTTESAPLYAPGVVDAVNRAQAVLKAARQADALIVHTNIRYHSKHFIDGGIWVQKAPVMKAMVEGNPLSEFCDEVLPLESELVVSKQYASAFLART